MGRAFETITEPLKAFIEAQHMFFVATAPSEGGRVNLSPKGYDSFRILDPNRVAYADITGSGAETIAHLADNGRITFMFCAFEGKPDIVRLYGTGRAVLPNDAEFPALVDQVGDQVGLRAVIVADIDRTSSSCGFAVPFMDFVEDRSRLSEYWGNKTDEDLSEYWRKKNSTSIDGLPALASSVDSLSQQG